MGGRRMSLVRALALTACAWALSAAGTWMLVVSMGGGGR